MKLFRKITAAALAAIMAVGAAPFSASAAEVKVPVNEATKYVDGLGAIWNLGNCFDASDCTWLSNEMDYETAWCGAKVTEKLIKAIKDMGFDTIRIPATWHNHVDGSYNISEQWMDRVEEVVEWSVDEGLYVILNVHHDIDKNYYYPDSEHYANSEKYMKKVWEQIADEFDDVGNQLIFEIINEPRLKGTNNEWWFQLNNPPENVVDSIDCINKLNQVSLDTIRKAGGKNKDRYILVGGYDTSVDGVTVNGFELPKDTVKDRLIVDFHLYTKSAGTYKQAVNKIYDKYVSKGIPAILSEYNLDPGPNKYNDSSAKYLSEWVAYARERGISCAIWDNNDVAYKIIDRASVKWTQEEIAKAVVKAGAPAMKSSTSTSSSSSSSSSKDKNKSKITVSAKQDGFYVNISWNKVDGASKYRVYRANSEDGKKTRIAQTTNTTTINRDSEVGGTYYYFVSSYDKKTKKWSSYSEPVTLSVTTKKAATALKAEKNGNKLKLFWNKVDGASKYQIYYSTDGKSFKKLSTISGSRTDVTVSGLDFKKYDYRLMIRPVDSHGNKGSFCKRITVK